MTDDQFEQEEIRENLIISQIIRNPYYRDTVLTQLKPSFFEDEDNRNLFKAIHSLVVKDKIQILDRKTLRLKFDNIDKLKEIFAEDDYPTENVNFLIKTTEKWGKTHSLSEAVIESADIINENPSDMQSIGRLIEKALSFSFEKNMGLNLKRDVRRRIDYYKKTDEKIPTGIPMLDYYTNGGLQKKTLTIISGSSGLGKTLAGTNISANFMMDMKESLKKIYRENHIKFKKKRMNGVYVTLELAEELIGRRVDSLVTEISYQNLQGAGKKLNRTFTEYSGGNLFIREYPPSKACTLNLKTYLKELELIEGYKPDFVMVDYIQLMKPNFDRNGMSTYEKYREIAEELREMAVELDIPVVTFSQVRREGYDNSSLNLTHISDSIGIVNTADLVIGMTRYVGDAEDVKKTEDGSRSYQMWKIMKNRLGKAGVYFLIELLHSHLKFSNIITDEDIEMMAKASKNNSTEEDEDRKEVNAITEVIGYNEEEGKKQEDRFIGAS